MAFCRSQRAQSGCPETAQRGGHGRSLGNGSLRVPESRPPSTRRHTDTRPLVRTWVRQAGSTQFPDTRDPIET